MEPTKESLLAVIKANDGAAAAQLLAQDPRLASAQLDDASAILTAVYYGAEDVVSVLLQQGVPLSYFEAAAVGDTRRIIEWLDEDPAVIDTYAPDGFTALGLAAFFGHRDVAAELLARGANVHIASNNTMHVMPLHSAVAHRHLAISELLLRHGADANAKQQQGFTPLLEAVHNGQTDMVTLLIEYGADVNLAKADGVTPLAMANETGNLDIKALLTAHGAR